MNGWGKNKAFYQRKPLFGKGNRTVELDADGKVVTLLEIPDHKINRT